jgi:hypothetical protein
MEPFQGETDMKHQTVKAPEGWAIHLFAARVRTGDEGLCVYTFPGAESWKLTRVTYPVDKQGKTLRPTIVDLSAPFNSLSELNKFLDAL